MSWIDISPIISERLGVFPGDTRFSREILLDYAKGHNLRLSAVKTTLHLGAHADSVGHYHRDGGGVDQRDVGAYLGTCQVVHVKTGQGRIQLQDVAGLVVKAPRVLFRTDSFPDPDHWNSDFRSFSPEVLTFLADHDVKLVGIDTPSVDPEDSKALESHQILHARGMAVLEGLVLTQVGEGLYTLIAPPLLIEGADASPVRALLHPQAGLIPE
ncbi:MAG: cyclase family protein [Bdellovibrionaceae bacterium]|nr:cyclase family protein [Pseudobdellovibrionaceae bacterium]